MIGNYVTVAGAHRLVTAPIAVQALALDGASDGEIDTMMAGMDGRSWQREADGISYVQGGGRLLAYSGQWLVRPPNGYVFAYDAAAFAAGFEAAA